MITQKIQIKPLSVNEAWQGRRFKTKKYKKFEHDLLLMLSKSNLPAPPYRLSFIFGFSNKASDCSNPIKLVEDILSKKYKFNDNQIYEISVLKQIVPKGSEFIDFTLETITPF